MNTIYEQPITGKSQGQDTAVTYYTLRSDYPNDFTKNCSLLSSEIDGNFYFLRGYDIKSFNIKVDGNGEKKLYLERLNGEVLEAKMASDDITGAFKFEFDEDEGIMTITYPDGRTVELKRFNTVKAATDGSIKGDGSIDNPLRISEVEKTGTYSPANELVEIPKDETMPDGDKLGKGYRVVTKEYVTKFGRLYNYDEVKKIAEQLNEIGSPWRIPSKEDWDEMINSIEECNEGRNHESKGSGYYGKKAGALLKQSGDMEDGTGLWNKSSNPDDLGEDKYGFNAIPVGFSGPRGDFLKPDADNDIEGYHLSTAFWTSTPAGLVNPENDEDTIYAKALYYKSSKVNQQVLSKESKLSLRLVKDFTRNNMSMFDNILGYWYPCTHIIAEHSKYWYSEIESLPEDAEAYAYDEIPTGDDIIKYEKYIKVGNRYYVLAERKYHHNKIWTSWNIGMNTMGFKSDQWNEGYYKLINEEDVPTTVEPTVKEEVPMNPIVGKDPEYIVINDAYYHLVDYGVYSQKYFINEWDGEKWVKKMMNEGDSVAILSGPNGTVNHEWRVFKQDENNDILIDTVEGFAGEINNSIIKYVDNKISDLRKYVDAQDEKTLESAKAYTDGKYEENLKAANAYTDEEIAKVNGKIDESIDAINEKIDSKAKELSNKISETAEELNEKIDGEIEVVNTKISEESKKLSDAINEKAIEINARIDSEVSTINEKIDNKVNEINEKIDAEVNSLDGKIEKETQDRINADNTEATNRHNNDIAKASHTIGGGDKETIEIKNNADETVVTLHFDGNFGEI